MENINQIIENSIKNSIANLFDIRDVEFVIESPKDLSFGDLATNIAMSLSRVLKRNPLDIAEEIKSDLQTAKLPFVESLSVAKPGFINIKISKDYYKQVLQHIFEAKETYGHNKEKKGKTILIEHTSPNPNKEYHLGHLKNTVTGLSISYLLEANGAKVYRDCIDNNRGIAIARLMWGYLNFAKKDESLPTDLNYWFENQEKWKTPESENMNPGRFVDKLYTKGSEDFKNNSDVESKVRQMVVDWEAEEPKNHALWKLTQEWVWQGYKQSLSRVGGWKFDKIWHESDIYKQGKNHVERGLREGIFRKLEDGAILTNLKDFKLPDTIVIKNDGTSLYITQDLELSYLKRTTFNPDELYWVIGPEQSLAMKQMFAVCSQLGFGKYEDFHHIPYGFVLVKNAKGESEKMSSRSGTQYYVNDLIDIAKEKIKVYITTEFSKEELEEISEKIAVAAIKYSLLKVSRTQDQIFDIDNTISLEGDSGPYILYTYSRSRSVISKGDFKNIYSSINGLDHDLEQSLLKELYKFPQVVKDATLNYAPNNIALYLFNLAQLFNRFYTELPILKAEQEDKNARLALTWATGQVLKNGLSLLGIETVEKM